MTWGGDGQRTWSAFPRVPFVMCESLDGTIPKPTESPCSLPPAPSPQQLGAQGLYLPQEGQSSESSANPTQTSEVLSWGWAPVLLVLFFLPLCDFQKVLYFLRPFRPSLYRGDGIPEEGLSAAPLPISFFSFLFFLRIGRKRFALFSSPLRLSQLTGTAAPAAREHLLGYAAHPFS